MAIFDTRIKLQQWAAWQRGGFGLGYVSPAGEIMRGAVGGGVPIAPIGDDAGLQYDRVVGALKRENYPMYEIIERAYLHRQSNAAIGREMNIPKRTVQLRIEQAEANIDEKFILSERLKYR